MGASFLADGVTPTFVGSVTEALSTVIDWIGSVVSSLLTGDLKTLLPLFAIGIAVSAFMLGMRAIRSVTWGA